MTSNVDTLYQRLGPGRAATRLVKLYPGNLEDDLKCDLIETVLNGVESQPPPYFALSYTWEPEYPKQNIALNGHGFTVGANLFNFLRRFRETLSLVCEALPHEIFLHQYILQKIFLSLPRGWQNWPKSRRDESMCSEVLPSVSQLILKPRLDNVSEGTSKILQRRWTIQDLQDLHENPKCFLNLWIDAISINQSDTGDKDIQIPLMTRIYRSATEVLIWLGDSTASDSNIVEKINEMLDTIKAGFNPNSSSRSASPVSMIEGMGISITKSSLLVAELVEKHAWFSRMWVIQELAAARFDPMVYVGCHGIRWELLSLWSSLLAHAVTHVNSIPEIVSNIDEILGAVDRLSSVRRSFQERVKRGFIKETESANLTIASTLYDLIKFTAQSFKCTEPVDRVFALTGLAVNETLLRPLLEPKYGKDIGQVFRDYTEYLLKHTKDLSILSREPSPRRKDMGNSPSWTPDFRDIVMAMGQPKTRAMRVEINNKGMDLELDGVRIGQISSSSHKPSGNAREFIQELLGAGGEDQEPKSKVERMRELDEVTSRMDATVQQIMATGTTTVETDDQTRQAELGRGLRGGQPKLLLTLEGGGQAVISQVTEPLEGAIVCMLRGAYDPCVLLPTKDGKYRFAGSCVVEGIRDPDEEYYVQNAIENFVLV